MRRRRVESRLERLGVGEVRGPRRHLRVFREVDSLRPPQAPQAQALLLCVVQAKN